MRGIDRGSGSFEISQIKQNDGSDRECPMQRERGFHTKS